MGLLKIQVNGKGLIPRGYGIAPRKSLINATDLSFISLVLNTKGLTVKYLNPQSGRLEELTKKNLNKVWAAYSSYKAPVAAATVSRPVVPEEKFETKDVEAESTVVDTTAEVEADVQAVVDEAALAVNVEPEDAREASEPATDEAAATGDIKPVIQSDRTNNRSSNNRKRKH